MLLPTSAALSTTAVMVTTALLPTGIVPRAQGRLLHPPWLEATDAPEISAGRVSLITTFCAPDGPRLTTWTV
ncbi:MAG: hypothetical protein R2873_06810 [Caldilineaceae bacterium]